MEATNHILALTSRLRESDELVKESQERESKMLREMEKYKRHFREARHENVQLKGRVCAYLLLRKPHGENGPRQ